MHMIKLSTKASLRQLRRSQLQRWSHSLSSPKIPLQLVNLFDLDYSALENVIQNIGAPRYRSEQLWRAVYDEKIFDFSQMQGLPKSLRHTLSSELSLSLGSICSEQRSSDGTIKWLIELPHGQRVETVFIPEPTRGTLCVSSQVGCSLDCTFCHTGTQTLKRNLRPSDILAQYFLAQSRLSQLQNTKELQNVKSTVTNVVFMGQGEPLYNRRHVFHAIRKLTDPNGIGMSRKRITVSTVGVAPAIPLVANEVNAQLAVSLHSAVNSIRSKIMSINRTYPLSALHQSCEKYLKYSVDKHNSSMDPRSRQRSRDSRISFEYTLLDGINDTDESAAALIKWCRSLGEHFAHINLIPFNPWPGVAYTPTPKHRFLEFQEKLKQAGLVATIRRPRGRDILAACGQLNSTMSDPKFANGALLKEA